MSREPVVLTFEDPPEKVRYDWDSIAKQAMARPGKWGKVFDRDRLSLAKAIQVSGIKALTPYLRQNASDGPGWQVKTRNTDLTATPPTCSLWIRYVPGKKG